MIDATVVGSGPNGLAAALTLARAGLSVRLLERADTIGGGLRSAELTLPGFRHDVCSAVHPSALAAPFFRAFGLSERVPFAIPDVSYGHALAPDRGVLAHRDLDATAADLGDDARTWRRLLGPLVDSLDAVVDFTGSNLLRLPRHPITAARFGLRALEQGTWLWDLRFIGREAPALLAGVSAHGITAQPSLAASGVGLVLAAHAHGRGWGLPVGGSQAIADALAAEFTALGGEIVTGVEVRSPAEVGGSRVTLLDTSPDFVERFAGDRLSGRWRRAIRRYRRGPGIGKVDAALDAPIPWRDPRLAAAPTVHLGGSRESIARSEDAVRLGRVPEEPFVLLVQPTVVDPSRAPAGKHVVWAYTHVPAGSDLDPTDLVLDRIEEHAPGFRDTVLAVAGRSAREVAAANPNDVGGDILGGAITMRQLVARPVLSPTPWRTPVEGVYLCSASTPPGPGVHGMSGWFAARAALRDRFGVRDIPYTTP